MRFIFDCEDEVCLPAAYRLVEEIKPFIEKMKTVANKKAIIGEIEILLIERNKNVKF